MSERVREILSEGDPRSDVHPSQAIRPSAGALTWLVDPGMAR